MSSTQNTNGLASSRWAAASSPAAVEAQAPASAPAPAPAPFPPSVQEDERQQAIKTHAAALGLQATARYGHRVGMAEALTELTRGAPGLSASRWAAPAPTPAAKTTTTITSPGLAASRWATPNPALAPAPISHPGSISLKVSNTGFYPRCQYNNHQRKLSG
ncbi:hypothetical protein B0T17DRAFT_617540 [Bombardia bombarda]|uniref:Uncharacterized protein n=1 Tax=Bombardia bombarda TaxID=252184 RepID=A0AA39X1C7_9PEZI|nr:hypothetical protein B0T17DRAFT_617540 [Bombardia bombarda]